MAMKSGRRPNDGSSHSYCAQPNVTMSVLSSVQVRAFFSIASDAATIRRTLGMIPPGIWGILNSALFAVRTSIGANWAGLSVT
jgi:hypothetical protein